MASILDHVTNAVPRATVYGSLKGSNVFTGRYIRRLYPSSNSLSYDPVSEREIKFVLASPSKTSFFDMRSAYLQFEIGEITMSLAGAAAKNANDDNVCLSEPAGTAWIQRLVIKCNGSVIEDIDNFNVLSAFFQRKILNRAQKNAHPEQGWHTIRNVLGKASKKDVLGSAAAAKGDYSYTQAYTGDKTLGEGVEKKNMVPGEWLVRAGGCTGDVLQVKLDLSGIFNMQTLTSGYYAPLEISMYLADPRICLKSNFETAVGVNYSIKAPRLCIDELVLTP